MTAEPPRSSSSSADSYVGSLISLTSKSEIRYEGILISINTEESSIALRNVRSFGTERRKKDGPQVPPSDKTYEYILFRGSDIKDLQVKSSPPVQSMMAVPNDPAIIQSHYPQAPITSTSLPLASDSDSGSVQDPSVQTTQMGLPRPTFQGSLPLYQPSGNLGTWNPSQYPSSANNVGGLAMPMYWQGIYGSSNGLQPQVQQHSLLRPPPGLSMPPMQQMLHYPPVSASFPNVPSNLSTSKLTEPPSALLPPFSMGTPNLPSSILAMQTPALASDSSASLIPNKSSNQTLPPAPLTSSLPLASSLSSMLDKSTIPSSVSHNSKTIAGPVLTHLTVSETATSLTGTATSYLNEGPMPSLVTPGQLLQSTPSSLNTSQPSLTAQKDVEVVQVSSPDLTPTSVPDETRIHEPILPLPPPSERKIHGTSSQNLYMHRGGRERGRGNRFSQPVTRFTEDFDFTAMNEKFNKDEVWGDLGKSSKVVEDGDMDDEDENGSPKNESKPVYVKDDFFDSLSCDSLDHGSRNGRTRFSEQLRKDSETFGYMPRHHGGRGGRGPGYGGRNRGGYYGRGYGYGGRARGWGRGYSNHTT